MNASHEEYMRQAIAQAQQVPEFPFGAVIVHQTNGQILARGKNGASNNPILHGEIDAIQVCAHAHPKINWAELSLYTTAEPCPMCQSAVAWAGIPTVYYGTSIPYLQQLGWHQIDIRAEEVARRTPFHQSKIRGGLLEAECNALFDQAKKGQGQNKL